MGSFDYTCCVSNLPISCGDEVRFLLLTENTSYVPGRPPIHMIAQWIPRTFPVKAKYDDYGTVKLLQPIDNWKCLLQKDLIEKQLGDNKWHDVAVHKNMTDAELLNALWEGRISVKSDNKRSLHVSQAMIREDVYQILLGLAVNYNKDADITEQLQWYGSHRTLGLYEHAMANPSPVEETIAPYKQVLDTLSALRYILHPGGANGPQCGDYKLHTKYLKALSKLKFKK